MARRAAQTQFEERRVEDLPFEGSCDKLEEYAAEVRQARKAILEEPTERFRAREEEIAAKYELPVHTARVEDRLGKWVAEYPAGTIIRAGEWQVPIKEYTTMEKVENGKGKKAGKPKRVKDDD